MNPLRGGGRPGLEQAARHPPGTAEDRIQRVWVSGALGADGRPS